MTLFADGAPNPRLPALLMRGLRGVANYYYYTIIAIRV